MSQLNTILNHIAPHLAQALQGDFAEMAKKFMLKEFKPSEVVIQGDVEPYLLNFVESTENLAAVKKADEKFQSELSSLGIDLAKLVKKVPAAKSVSMDFKPQMILSSIFLVAYFGMLGAIFYVEVSDSLNMKKGENSLMGELQILFGVLTAGVGQILSFWFNSQTKRGCK